MIRSNTLERLTSEQRSEMLRRRGIVPPCFSSSSDSDDDDFLEHVQIPFVPPYDPSTWERPVTKYICKKSGVMHFPKTIGRQIPDWLRSIVLQDNGSRRIYSCTITAAERCKEEKWLAGKEWNKFVKDQKLKKGDVLRFEIRAQPHVLFVSISRK